MNRRVFRSPVGVAVRYWTPASTKNKIKNVELGLLKIW